MRHFFYSLLYAILISIGIMLIFSIFFLVKNGKLELGFFQSKGSISSIIRGISLGLSGSYLAFCISKVYPGDNRAFRRYLLYILGSFIVVPIVILLVDLSFYTNWSLPEIQAFIGSLHWNYFIFPTIIAIIIGSFFYLFYFYNQYKNKQIKQQKQIAGEATAQLETLKNQIDPHFLFNSLNVLIGLIEEDQHNAIIYTKSLSKIYRYILEQKDKELTSLSEEMAFADSYISLLKLRFEDAIQYEKKVSDRGAKKIVPLSLQLLLENCIQHNRISEEQPLFIRIFLEGDRLVVVNNLQEKQFPNESTKIGLNNIKERYSLLCQEQVIIDKTVDQFIVKLPLLA